METNKGTSTMEIEHYSINQSTSQSCFYDCQLYEIFCILGNGNGWMDDQMNWRMKLDIKCHIFLKLSSKPAVYSFYIIGCVI